MGLFNRKPKIHIQDNGNAAAEILPYGSYRMNWERQSMPDPGAQAYAWETLGLSPFNFINSGYGFTRNWRTLNPQSYIGNAVALAGIPQLAGGIIFQPLIR